MAATQCSQACTHDGDDLMKFNPSIRKMKKGDLRDFDRDMVAGARWAGLSISEAAHLLRF